MNRKIVAVFLIVISCGILICSCGEIYQSQQEQSKILTFKNILPFSTYRMQPAMNPVSDKNSGYPEEMITENNNPDWYLNQGIYMYNQENELVFVSHNDVEKYEKDGWYKEPVAFVSNGKEEKYVLKSEMEEHRQNGWQILNYSEKLSPLGAQIKDYIKNRSGKYGIYIKNLENGEQLIINDGKYSTASIIKLFVMTGIYNEIAKGTVVKSQNVYERLEDMITISDNYASNYLVKVMGQGNYKKGFELENEMTKSMGCVNTQHLSLFIEAGDYVSYGRNFVSPVDCGIVLEKLYKGTLISEKYSDEMLRLLKRQTRKNKIPYLLPQETICANKTGETATVQSDVGIVYSPGADYIICVLTNNAGNGIADIQRISKMVYNYFN